MTALNNAIAHFSSRFCAEADNGTGSIICSPLSAEIILALLTLGTTGTSHEELLNALSMPDDDNVRTTFKDMTQKLQSSNGLEISLANRIYIMKTAHDLVKKFKDDAEKNFDASIQKLDFSAPDAVDTVNTWVSGKTNQKIKDLLPPNSLDSMTRMVLVNAIYFKGTWKKKFDPKRSSDGPFYLSETDKVDIPFMHMKDTFKYAVNEGLDAMLAEFPYAGDRASLLVVLPNKIDGLGLVMKQLATGFDLLAIRETMAPRELMVSLPKFKVETEIDLIPVLSKLGIVSIFQPGCSDITGLIKEIDSLYVSKAVQKAFIEVNEEGTEAAAATGGIVRMRRAIRNEPARFVVDRPALYAVVVDDVPVFVGRLTFRATAAAHTEL